MASRKVNLFVVAGVGVALYYVLSRQLRLMKKVDNLLGFVVPPDVYGSQPPPPQPPPQQQQNRRSQYEQQQQQEQVGQNYPQAEFFPVEAAHNDAGGGGFPPNDRTFNEYFQQPATEQQREPSVFEEHDAEPPRAKKRNKRDRNRRVKFEGDEQSSRKGPTTLARTNAPMSADEQNYNSEVFRVGGSEDELEFDASNLHNRK